MENYFVFFNGVMDCFCDFFNYIGEVFFEIPWSAFLIWFGLTLLAIVLPIKLNRIRIRF